MQELIKKAEKLLKDLISEAKRSEQYVTEEKKDSFRRFKEEQVDTIMQLVAALAEKDSAGNIYGQPMPCAIDLECVILGAILCDSTGFSKVAHILTAASFYNDNNGIIFGCMSSLYNDSKPIDLCTVTVELKKIGKMEKVDAPNYLCHLTERVASAANIEYHAFIVAQKYMQREIIIKCAAATQAAYSEDADVFATIQDIKQITYNQVKTAHQ